MASLEIKAGGPKARKIAAALKEKLGIENPRVWYETIRGPAIEMCGYEGGWYYADGDSCEDVLGHNFAEAMEMIDLQARIQCDSKS